MAALSVATGLTLLSDEGVLPPNLSRQALAFATPAETNKLGSDGLALRRTATALAMDDHTSDGSAELSPTAMEFLVHDLASSPAPARSAQEAAPLQSGYPYGGWAAASVDVPATASSPTSGSPIDVLA